MSALLFIRQRRKLMEQYEFINSLRLAMHGQPRDVDQVYRALSREAEFPIAPSEEE